MYWRTWACVEALDGVLGYDKGTCLSLGHGPMDWAALSDAMALAWAWLNDDVAPLPRPILANVS